MFSISFLKAQCPTCKGNKIGKFRYDDCGGLPSLITACISQKDVYKYLQSSRGWIICGILAQSKMLHALYSYQNNN
jgi:hypothetical protein